MLDDAYRAIVDVMSEGAVLQLADGTIAACNAAAERILGFTTDPITGLTSTKQRWEAVREDGSPLESNEQPGMVTQATGRPLTGVVMGLTRPTGEQHWISINTRPLVRQGESTPYAVVATFVDITAKREQQREIEQLSLVARRTDDAVVITDLSGVTVWVNDAFLRMTGYAIDEVLGMTPGKRLQGPETDPDTALRMRHALEQHEGFSGEVLNYRKDGTSFWIELSITPIRDEGGGVIQYFSLARDITKRKDSARSLSQLSSAVEASIDGVALIDSFQEFRFVNDAFARLHGFDKGEHLLGKSWRSFYDADQTARFDNEIFPALYVGDRWRGEVIGRRVGGTRFPEELSLTLLQGGSIVCIVRDVSERKEMEEALRRMSLVDQLTGLYNRRGFFMLAQQQLNVARSSPGSCFLIYLDVNDFKSINDSHGHATGDEALVSVARILRETLRDSDILGRLGGDEFVALAVNCLDSSGTVLLDRLDERIAAHNAQSGLRYSLSIGRGMVRFDPDDPKNLQQLLDQADERLYGDKKEARTGSREPRARTREQGAGE